MAKKKEDDNLTRCSNEALAAGMTYGKYMALKYEKEQVPKAKAPTPPPGWKVCPHCGKKFYAEHGKRRYCSEFCQQQANYKAHRDRIFEKKSVPPAICRVCGHEFTPPKRDGRIKYCSDECRSKAWEAKRLANKKKRGAKDGD